MPVGYFGRCDGPGCEEWKEMKTGAGNTETVPAGWAAVDVKVQRFGLPNPGKRIFHSRRCFLNWANNTHAAAADVALKRELGEEGEEGDQV